MKQIGDSLELSATDLVGYLNCRHLSGLDRAVAEGALAKPKVWDPLLQVLWERGSIHEQNYVEHLTSAGLEVVRIDGVEVTNEAVSETLAAMKRGTPVIVQGALSYGGWVGRADMPRTPRLFTREPGLRRMISFIRQWPGCAVSCWATAGRAEGD